VSPPINKIKDDDSNIRIIANLKLDKHQLRLDHQQLQVNRQLHARLHCLPAKYNPSHSEFNDMEKMQKAAALDLSNFKTSTTNSFSTMNEVLDSRGNISKGSTKGL
jgi:hypothetical protein